MGEERRSNEKRRGEPPAITTPAITTPAITTLDVRPILATGVDPLDDILAALAGVAPGAALLLTVPFRPTPLLALLTGRGHGVTLRALNGGLYAVVVIVDRGVTPIDVSDLEPPEPLEIVLCATTELARDEVRLYWLPRYPRMLVPLLEDRAVRWQLVALDDGSALLHLRGT